MKTASAILTLCALLLGAHAQTTDTATTATRGVLSMTETDARTKYGTPVLEIKPGNPVLTQMAPAELALTFEKNGIYIAIQFYHGKVAKVQYIRKDKQPFTRREAVVLLTNNETVRWVFFGNTFGDREDDEKWESDDRSSVAINSTSQSLLSVVTREFTKAITAASESSLRGL